MMRSDKFKKERRGNYKKHRCSRNILSKEFLDECNKYGLMAMDENRRFEQSREA